MTINLSMPEVTELKPQITVIGVGGAGGNAVNNMINARLEGVEFVATNTDAQALVLSQAERRLQLGVRVTQGLGAGSRPDMGRAAAEEVIEEITEYLQGSHMVFITAGMGGGTGTGAAPVIAQAARDRGALTVGVVTKPFQFEGAHRMAIAEAGIDELQHHVDTLIVIPNQNLFRVANEKTTFADAFKMADDVLYAGVRGVTDLMVMPGLINLDFADIRTVMMEMGKAMMGTGEAEGEKRALEAAEAAIANPLLDDVSMKGAKGVLINITGGADMTLFEVDEAANRIREEIDSDANIIFGSTFDESLEGRMRLSLVATGIGAEAAMPRLHSFAQTNAVGTLHVVPAAEEAPAHAAAAEPVAQQASEAPPVQPPLQLAAERASPPPAVRSADPLTGGATMHAPAGGGTVAAAAAVAVEAPAEAPMAEARPAPTAPAPASAEKPFIPPRPMAPTGRAARPATADPFAAAAVANGAQPGPAKPSLFERMTGTGRARKEPAAAPAPIAAKAQPSATVGMSSLFKAPPAARPEEPAAAPAAPARAAADKPMGGEEDLLEIPAFLRRQAN